MRIAVTADPELPVPPKLYGGAERIVDMLVRGLTARGHRVTLFANPASDVPCELVPYEGKSSVAWNDMLKNMSLVSHAVKRGNFDLVHSFGRLAYLLPLLPTRIPKIMSYGRWISARSVILGTLFSSGTLHFTACSRFMIEEVKKFGKWHVIYNMVPVSSYRFNPSVPAGAPLVFLGRVEHGKGTHLAIEVAMKCSRRLVIAGNVEDEHRGYFEEEVAPHLCPGKVEYVGPVDDAQKNELLGGAAAMLMPILWREPFGMVMAEALACGTPVIALRRGAVPEIVEDGKNGFICDDTDGMARAVGRLGELDRAACRRVAQDRFSQDVIVGAYEALYRELARR